MSFVPAADYRIVTDSDAVAGVTLENLKVGMAVVQSVQFSEQMVRSYAALVADVAPVHTDGDYAASMGFDRPIAHGLLLASRFSRLMGMYLPGPSTVIQSVRLNFIRPVFCDELVEYSARVMSISVAVKAVVLGLSAKKADGSDAVSGQGQCVYKLDKK